MYFFKALGLNLYIEIMWKEMSGMALVLGDFRCAEVLVLLKNAA